MKAAVDAYAAAAAKMAGVEARAFASVYATLKPNQQSNAPQAFALMAGMFQPAPPRAGGRGQRGGGAVQMTRLETLEADFKLTKDQKKAVKSILDEAHKAAAPTREALTRTRSALAAAIAASK